MALERVARVVGVVATACTVLFVLVLRARQRSGADGEALLLFIAFAPVVAVLCLASLGLLAAAAGRRQARPATFALAGLPALVGLRLVLVLAGWPLDLDLLNG